MDYSKYSVEDFLLDDRFRKWIIDPEKDDNIFWEQWLAENPSRAKDLVEARKVLLNLSMKDYKIADEESNDLWDRIEKEIDLTDDIPSDTKIIPINSTSILRRSAEKKRFNFQWVKIASILLLLVIASVVWIEFNTPSQSSESVSQEMVAKETELGMKSLITLSDGTQVTLNSGSKLSYHPHFNAKSRDVYLEGEAYFDVAKDIKRPFNVHAGDIITTALGTEFNVNSYQDGDKGILIALVEGKVEVKRKDVLNADTADQYILLPGDLANYQAQEKTFTLSRFDIKEQTAWKDGNLYFSNADEDEVYQRLERWYGVKFENRNNSGKKWDYSAEFKNQNIHQVLTSLSFTMSFDYKIENSNIYITYKNP